MSESFVIVVRGLMPHLSVLEIAALLALRVIWWLPDWWLKLVAAADATRRLRHGLSRSTYHD